MKRAPLVFLVPILVLACGLLAASRSPALDLPVRYPDREPLTAPAYRGDALVIRLAPAASRDARRARPAGPAESALEPARALGLSAVDRLAASLGARFERVFQGETPPVAGSAEPDLTSYFRVYLAPGTELENALARFQSLPEVASVEPIAVTRVSVTVPNDSLWSESWWLHQTPLGGIRAPDGWDYTTGDTSIVVAIIDTGVLGYHPDLGGTTLGLPGQMWTNWAERGGIAAFDDDGNGFTDDAAGWDFVNRGTSSNVVPGEDWAEADPDPSDFAGHGTLVAGLVGALSDNGIGGSGTAWKVRLMPLRIGWAEICQPPSQGCEQWLVDMSFAAAAIRYATRMGATVINCSFETLSQGNLLQDAVASARAGVTIVCSAGVQGASHALQDMTEVITVTASDANDHVSPTENSGDFVDLAAPGEDITSTFLARTGGGTGPPEPAYATFSGTSLSSPLVAGATALVHARRRALGERPLGAHSMMFRMRETADDIRAQNPGQSGYGTGRLNLLRALTDPPTSFARKLGATVIGPPVLLPTSAGRPRAALATFDNKIVLLDVQTADTIAVATLPGRPSRQIAAADMGGTNGVCLFVGTLNGRVAGFNAQLAPLPGWPVEGDNTGFSMNGGPALGDLDGDGVLEVVCGLADGGVYAWRVNGTLLDGFPVSTGTQALSGPVALGDIDGLPGVEIVAANRNGGIHVLRSDGSEPAGWPVPLSPTSSPLIMRLGHEAGPSIVVCTSNTLRAYSPVGVQRFSSTASGSNLQDPAAGDLDGDGADEIVVAFSAPNSIAAVDSAGAALVGRGWPRTLAASPTGPVLIGRLQPGPRPGVYVVTGGAQIALTDSAVILPQFPKPGAAGANPAFADVDGDGRTEVVAGTGADSVLYVYDAGAGTWGAGDQPWGTPRANFARTGSRLYSPSIPALDDLPPATVAGLRADSVTAETLVLKWVAPGDDGTVGRATTYQLQMTTRAGAAGDFTSGTNLPAAAPDPAGTPQRLPVRGLAPHTAYFFSLRARDDAGNWSAASNLVRVLTPLGGNRAARRDGVPGIAARFQPGMLWVDLEWYAPETAPGVARWIELYDLGGRKLARIALGEGEEGVARWDGRDEHGRRAPAGLYFARLTSGSLRAQARVVLIP